jgi:hypothetical protein
MATGIGSASFTICINILHTALLQIPAWILQQSANCQDRSEALQKIDQLH